MSEPYPETEQAPPVEPEVPADGPPDADKEELDDE